MTKALLIALPLLLAGADDSTSDSSSDTTREETTNTSYSVNDLTISWLAPNLNKEACNSLSEDVTITVSTNQVLTNAKFYAWFPDSGSECTNVATETDNQIVNGTAITSLGSHEETVTLEYEVLFNRANADGGDVCTTNTGGQEFKLCFLIDVEEGTALNPTNPDGEIDSTEPNGYVLFTVDTLAPPAPDAPTVIARDSALFISAMVSVEGDDIESDDITSWEVRYREALVSETETSADDTTEETSGEEDTEEALATCDDWDDFSDKSTTNYGTSATIEVPATNGIEYELCVYALDSAGNRSLPSESIKAEPIDECDFMECYPGKIEVGHCAATGTQVWIWALLGAFAFIRRRLRQGADHE